MKGHLLALALFGAVAGCSVTEVAQDPAQQREAALYLAQYQNSQRPHWESLTGSYQGGEFKSDFVAYLEGREVTVIHERYDLGGFGQGEIDFHFRDEQLYLVKKRSNEPGAQGALEPQQMLLIFDSDGQALLSQKKMGEQALPVPDLERDGLVRHARILRESVAGRQQAANFQ